MQLTISQTDAAFIRHVLQSLINSAPFDRAWRRRLGRIQDKLSESRGLFSLYKLKQKEAAVILMVLGRAAKSLESEVAAPDPDGLTPEQKEERSIRKNQLDMNRQYMVTIINKLSEDLGHEST